MNSIYELRFLQHPINLGANKSRFALEVQLVKHSRVKIMMNAIPGDWTLEILFTNPILRLGGDLAALVPVWGICVLSFSIRSDSLFYTNLMWTNNWICIGFWKVSKWTAAQSGAVDLTSAISVKVRKWPLR